jgi:uncharacterized protein
MLKKTVVIGASPNEDRYANRAVRSLLRHGHPVEAVGLRVGMIDTVQVQKGFPPITDVDTVTLYVGPKNQPFWYDYILSLKPKRIIFNPGTENPEFENRAAAQGIEIEIACTLVMLNLGQF